MINKQINNCQRPLETGSKLIEGGISNFFKWLQSGPEISG